jgi:hypothetical protein
MNMETLPQEESGEKRFENTRITDTRESRIKLSTESGGLNSCPESFSDDIDLDWETSKSDNVFEVLYLYYRAYDNITSAMIDKNKKIIENFWNEKLTEAQSSISTAKKYGGLDSIQRYPRILEKAYKELTFDENAPRKCFEQIIRRKQESLRSFIDDTLMQGEYTPVLIRKKVTQKGIAAGLTEEEVDSYLIELLKEKKFVPERGNSDDPLSEEWYSPEKIEERKNSKTDGLQKQLGSIIQSILSDDIFEPSELVPLKEKGKQLGYSEEQLLIDFEKTLDRKSVV